MASESPDILNTVLKYCKPVEWEDADYSSELTHLFELQPDDDEFINEAKKFEFDVSHLKSFKRIQSPLLLGRFKIRKEQMLFRGIMMKEKKYYHAVGKQDLTVALKYNMDIRRYTVKNGCSCDENKNPIFYKTPIKAYDKIKPYVTDVAIIICKILLREYDNPATVVGTNDANFIPIYVAEV